MWVPGVKAVRVDGGEGARAFWCAMDRTGTVCARLAAVGVGLALVVGGFVLPSGAEGQRLRAQVYLTQAQVPRNLSERQLLRWARGHQSTRLRETQEAELDDREWRANLVISFNRPPGDIEFHVLFYDTEDGPRRFLQDMSTYVNDPDQKTYVQRIRLERPEFEPNRRTEMVVTVRRNEVARKSFHLLGEERRRSGEVSFSEEETPEGRAAAARETQPEQPEPEEPAIPAYEEPTTQSSDVDPTQMELIGANEPQEVEPSEAGRSGGLCSVAPARASDLALLALFAAPAAVMARRLRRRPRR